MSGTPSAREEVLGRLLEITATSSLPPSMVQSTRDIEVDMDDDEPEFVPSFDGLPEFGHWKVILGRACKMLPISNIDFLSIATCDTVGSVNWAELFKRCTTVTTIQAIGHEAGGLIRDLTPPNTKEGKKKKRDDGTSAIPAPGPIICPQPEVAGIPRLGLHRNQVSLRRPVRRSRQ
jgi:hypothetical protein